MSSERLCTFSLHSVSSGRFESDSKCEEFDSKSKVFMEIAILEIKSVNEECY